jgi:hypothetical protein
VWQSGRDEDKDKHRSHKLAEHHSYQQGRTTAIDDIRSADSSHGLVS